MRNLITDKGFDKGSARLTVGGRAIRVAWRINPSNNHECSEATPYCFKADEPQLLTLLPRSNSSLPRPRGTDTL